jgi:hypothetical protein
MGHVNHDDLRRMVEKGMVTGITLDVSSKAEFCETCIKSKAVRKPFPKESRTEYKTYGAKVVADVWGPAPIRKKYNCNKGLCGYGSKGSAVESPLKYSIM